MEGIVGAAVGFGFASLLEWMRWRREDRKRFMDERRRAYSRFLHAANFLARTPLVAGEAAGKFRLQMVVDVLATRWEIGLLGPSEIRAALARAWSPVTDCMERPLSGTADPRAAKLGEVLEAFEKAARADMGTA